MANFYGSAIGFGGGGSASFEVTSTGAASVTTYTIGSDEYIVHKFISSGSTFVGTGIVGCDVFILAGGGCGPTGPGGGGGGGGYRVLTNQTIAAGTYTQTVGAGGTAAGNYGDVNIAGDTTCLGLSTTGGGTGWVISGAAGGSGGGGGYAGSVGGAGNLGSYSPVEGYDGYGPTGNYAAGGGGGSSAASTGKNGGAGTNNTYTDNSTSTHYGAGGGGGGSIQCGGAGAAGGSGATAGFKGTGSYGHASANQGGGAGGSHNGLKANGGSGIIIFRYVLANQ